MAFLRQQVFLFLVCVYGAFGCSPVAAIYGDRARYSPAYHGYVMARSDGSDDPGKDDTVLLLRDPLTGNKLACREEVEEWRELHEDLAADLVHDRRAAIAAAVTSSVLFAPIAAAEPLGSLATFEAFMATGSFYDLLRTKSGPELVAAGVALYDRKRFPQSSLALEHALAKDDSVGVQQKTYYYLGLAYVEQGKRARAGAALSAFLDRAAVRDVESYRTAEKTLAEIGAPRRRCHSREPVDLHW